VGGGDESPLRSARGDASPSESGDVAVVIDLAEDGLDRVFRLLQTTRPWSLAITRRMKS
jgi:hypothetical protein